MTNVFTGSATTPSVFRKLNARRRMLAEFQTYWDRTRVIEPKLTKPVTDEPTGKPALPVAGDISKPFEKVARTMRHTYRPFRVGVDGRI